MTLIMMIMIPMKKIAPMVPRDWFTMCWRLDDFEDDYEDENHNDDVDEVDNYNRTHGVVYNVWKFGWLCQVGAHCRIGSNTQTLCIIIMMTMMMMMTTTMVRSACNEIMLWGLEDKKHNNGKKRTFREKWGPMLELLRTSSRYFHQNAKRS